LNCELCGNNIRGEAQAVNIDGGLFRVCNNCSRLGTPARIPARAPPRERAPSSFAPSAQRTGNPPRPPRSSPPPGSSYADEDVELRPDHAKVIKAARELHGLSQEELGRKINEKPSVIGHLETGSLKPDDALARKLEHFLKIQLFVPVDEIEGDGSAS
jgi:putative transcription factor